MKQGNHRNGVLKARMRKAGVVPMRVTVGEEIPAPSSKSSSKVSGSAPRTPRSLGGAPTRAWQYEGVNYSSLDQWISGQAMKYLVP